MTSPAIIRARELAASMKTWGPHPENAILTGQWDHGSIVQSFVQQAEEELLRDLPENGEE